MVKPALQLRLGQQLTLTPQLQQAIRLLQLSTLELSQEIQTALESNPLLEHEEFSDGDANGEAETDSSEAADAAPDPEDLPEWDDTYTTRQSSPGVPEGLADRMPEGDTRSEEGLCEHLMWQLRLTPMSDRDRSIAAVIIESLDDSGYFEESTETVREMLAPELHVDLDEVEAVLHRVQRFDPVGVAARTLSECLLVQLGELAPETPHLETARAVTASHLDDLARGETGRIRKALGIDEAELDAATTLVRSLDPRPGSAIARPGAEYVVPDVYVTRHNGDWHVSLNPRALPRLCINNYYAGLIGETQGENASYLRGQLQEARWFLKSIRTRNDTLLSVANAIVEAQSEFLEHGDEAMKPMVLRDIADTVDMHESTISRVTTRKYMHTPRGVFEFKYFFSSHVGTADGGECSSTAIRAMIRRLVDDEPPGKPLSDSRITELLRDRGIDVARRTVAKYREAMKIPSSTERRRLAKAGLGSPRGSQPAQRSS